MGNDFLFKSLRRVVCPWQAQLFSLHGGYPASNVPFYDSDQPLIQTLLTGNFCTHNRMFNAMCPAPPQVMEKTAHLHKANIHICPPSLFYF